MSSRKNISINSILLDTENARHGDQESQREIYAWMCSGDIAPKVLRLATEIAKKGISPLDTPAVVPSPNGERKPWIVVEGNRRVAALKFLNDPKLCPDPKLRKQYERLKKNAETPVKSKFEFVTFDNIDIASYWIELRHGGENGGAGIISWGPMEIDNFAARLGKKTTNRPAVEILSYALKKNLITHEEFKSVPVTTLFRLVSTPAARKDLGFDLIKGKIHRVASENYFDQAIERVLKILATGEKTVTNLKTKDLREGFTKTLRSEDNWPEYETESPTPIDESANDNWKSAADDSESDEGDASTHKPRKSRTPQTPSWDRKSLFTRGKDGLSISENNSKAWNIVAELRRLKTGGSTGTPIAVAMLLRALIETSTNRYRDVYGVKADQDFTRQVAIIADHMRSNSRITVDQHTLINRMTRDTESMLHVKTLQKYVHSDAFHPTADVLNSLWDQISFFLRECWS